MSPDLITWLIILWGAVGILLVFVQLAGAMIYDLMEIRALRRFRRHPFALAYRKRPLISVIIPTHNDAGTILQCLDSVLASSYRKYDILVIDQASNDKTRPLVWQYIAEHPNKPIELVARRRQPHLAESLRMASRKISGDLVLVLEPGNLLAAGALKRAVWRFNAFGALDGLVPRLRYRQADSVAGVFQKYYQLLNLRRLKLAGIFNGVPSNEPLTTFMVRRESLGRLTCSASYPAAKAPDSLPGTAELRIGFAHNVVVFSRPVGSFAQWFARRSARTPGRYMLPYPPLSFGRRLGWGAAAASASLGHLFILATPVVVTYFLYLALRARQPIFLLVAWGALVVVLLSSIWGDEYLKLRDKLGYALAMPLSFGMFYLAAFAPLAALLRTGLSGIFRYPARFRKVPA